MKHILILLILLSALILCACSDNTEAETEITDTTSETSATTFNQYLLTRGWTGDELLASVFYFGEYHPLPMDLEDYPEFTLSGETLYFPDGSYATIATDGEGRIKTLYLTAESAPKDFSVYGIDFSAVPYDIQKNVGFANSIEGDEDTTLIFGFEGGGISQLVFEFNEKKLVSVFISA